MTYIQSNITFGSYTFPAGFYVDAMQQPTQIDDVKIPFLDGSLAPVGTRAAKTIRISGYIGGWGAVDSSGNQITTLDQCEAEFQLLQSYLESGYQQLTVGNSPARYIMAQKKQMSYTPVESGGRLGIFVQIDFLAQDPRWLSSATHSQSYAGSISWVYYNLNNAGTALTYPKCTITTASAVGSTIKNPAFSINVGSGTIYAQCLFSTSPSDILVIDPDPRNRASAVKLNGSARLDLIGTSGLTNNAGNAAFFPYLPSGSNQVGVYFGDTGSSGSNSATVQWQDAWY